MNRASAIRVFVRLTRRSIRSKSRTEMIIAAVMATQISVRTSAEPRSQVFR